MLENGFELVYVSLVNTFLLVASKWYTNTLIRWLLYLLIYAWIVTLIYGHFDSMLL